MVPDLLKEAVHLEVSSNRSHETFVVDYIILCTRKFPSFALGHLAKEIVDIGFPHL